MFAQQDEDAGVRNTNVRDIASHRETMRFPEENAWFRVAWRCRANSYSEHHRLRLAAQHTHDARQTTNNVLALRHTHRAYVYLPQFH